MTTPEQQAQVGQWRKDFEEQRCPPLIKMRQMDGLYANHDARIAWANYLAGREAQQREGEQLKDRWQRQAYACRVVQDTTIAQLQAQVKELEARLGVGEAVAWRAYGAGHWNDGKPNQQSIDYYGSAIEYAYAQPPAAQKDIGPNAEANAEIAESVIRWLTHPERYGNSLDFSEGLDVEELLNEHERELLAQIPERESDPVKRTMAAIQKPAQQPAAQVPKWLPIETAPKNGTAFLSHSPTHTTYPFRVTWWDEELNAWSWRKGTYYKVAPIYWMPLPAAPTHKESK